MLADGARRAFCAIGWIALVALSQLVPLVLWRFDEALWHYEFPLAQDLACGGVLLIGVVCAWRLRRSGRDWRHGQTRDLLSFVPLLGWVAVTAHYLVLTVQPLPMPWDYQQYAQAGQQLLAGHTPYGGGYIYSPIPAQAWECGYWVLERLGVGPGATGDRGSMGALFSLYNYLQAMLIGLAYLLSYRFARCLRFDATTAAVLVATVFLVNTPLVVLLHQGQVDLWVLLPLLLGLLWGYRTPVWAGAAAALALAVKPYTLALVPAWVRDRRWTGCAAMAGAAAMLLGISLLANGPGPWRQFLSLCLHFPRGTQPDDCGMHAVLYNSLLMLHLGPDLAARIALPASRVAGLGLVACAGVRWLRRERMAQSRTGEDLTVWRSWGHTLDLVALLLLIAPLAWMHHYVLAIPVFLWCLACGSPRGPLPLVAAGLLTFAVPYLTVFPLSLCRLAGLLIMLSTSRLLPAALSDSSRASCATA